MVLLGDKLKWKLILVCMEIVLILTQHRCTVCANHTIVSESFWTHPTELLGVVGHVKSHFGLIGHGVSVSVSAR
jgi:hypothetical protein